MDFRTALEREEHRLEETKIEEKSCGAVLYQIKENIPNYLIVESSSGHISFSKGHVEAQETEWETACREIFEETGIKKMHRIEGFRERFVCRTKSGNKKEIIYFLAEFMEKTILLQDGELVNYWLLPLEEALQRINTEEEKKILRKADELLKEKKYE